METQEYKPEVLKSLRNQDKDTCCAQREMTAKEVLHEKAKGLHMQADRLYSLAQSLPDNLNRDADQAIKLLLNNFR